jgi:uncharacterized iron-regulated membrane protein
VSFVSGWLRRPQTTWLRKAVFQIHLWAGLSLGLYIAVVCVSGSAVVFRNDIYDVLADKLRVAAEGRPLTREQLAQVLQASHPGYALRAVRPGRDGQEASEVTLSHIGGSLGGSQIERLVNPYTGEDRGPAISGWFRLFKWLSNLHGNLLLGSDGMTANAIGGGLTAALCLTGLVIWWPGVNQWRRALTIRAGSGWKRLTWDLHSAVGFWTFALLFMWGLTGCYFVFPQPFRATVDYFTPVNPPRAPQAPGMQPAAPRAPQGSAAFTLPRRRRPLTLGGKILRSFSLAHYGNFAGWQVKALWVALGLTPVVLYFSALLMWWNRVLRPALRRTKSRTKSRMKPSRLQRYQNV